MMSGLQTALRKLWVDHIVWTRSYIAAAVAGAPDAGAAATRLLKNQEDIGNAIIPVYGRAAGARLTELLKEHIMIAVDLIASAKAGDMVKFQEYDMKWTKNVEDIATFLSDANPMHWPRKDVVDLLMLHLNLTKKEVMARLNQKWEEDVMAFDDIFTEIMTVADTLADGIHKQFPGKVT